MPPNIKFIADGHRYLIEETGQELRSATQFISNFFEKFDKDYWSKYIAARDGFTVKDVLKKWNDKSKESMGFGTLVHAYAEALIKNKELPDPLTQRHSVYFSAVDLFMKEEPYEFFDAEKVIGSPSLGIAGTIDGLSKIGDEVFLIDWKTNEKIDFQGYNGKACLKPLDNLPDCNFSKYSLQLSLYRYILEKEDGIAVSGQRLVHLYPDGTYHNIEVPYLKEEVEKMLAFEGVL